MSETLDTGRRRTATVVVSPWHMRAGTYSADTRSHRASDRWPDTAGRPLRWRTDAEIRAGS